MTRINVIPPAELTDQHLLAEYRELPRIFALARPDVPAPPRYILGAGHVRFFYTRTGYLSRRQAALIAECQARGFAVQHTSAPPPVPGCDADWFPTAADRRVNLERLHVRLLARLGWYTHRGQPVAADFYPLAYTL